MQHNAVVEMARVKSHNSRARQAGQPYTLTYEQWIATLDHFEWKCAYCQGPFQLLEHFIPIRAGGGTTQDNCVPACHGCNTYKSLRNPLTSALPRIQASLVTVYLYLLELGPGAPLPPSLNPIKEEIPPSPVIVEKLTAQEMIARFGSEEAFWQSQKERTWALYGKPERKKSPPRKRPKSAFFNPKKENLEILYMRLVEQKNQTS